MDVLSTVQSTVNVSEVATAAEGAPSPALEKVVAGVDNGGVVRSIEVDATGRVVTINPGIPAALGQAAMVGSTSVVIASDQTAVPVSAAALPLPTGAATEATLAAMSAKLPATLGQKTMANSEAVVIASDQSSLPTTEARLPAALGQQAMAGSLPVVLASNQSSLPALIQNQFVKVAFDAIVPTFNATSDVYVYKTGGVGGATVATLTVSYVDATKAVITSIVVV